MNEFKLEHGSGSSGAAASLQHSRGFSSEGVRDHWARVDDIYKGFRHEEIVKTHIQDGLLPSLPQSRRSRHLMTLWYRSAAK